MPPASSLHDAVRESILGERKTSDMKMIAFRECLRNSINVFVIVVDYSSIRVA